MELITLTLFLSFIFNFIWENLHAPLYTLHLGKIITERTLIIATLGDVVILSLFAILWWYILLLKKHFWFVIPLGLLVAYAIEKFGLATQRWEYEPTMPIIPYLNIGLSPFLQLSVTSIIMILILRFVIS